MASVTITYTVPDKSSVDLILSYDPSQVDANGNVVATSASGTYKTLDATGAVVDTDTITGIVAPGAILGPDDKVNTKGLTPIVSLDGVEFTIDKAADGDDGNGHVTFGSEVISGYYELSKGNATGVSLTASSTSNPPPSTGTSNPPPSTGTTNPPPSTGTPSGPTSGGPLSIDPTVTFDGTDGFIVTGQVADPTRVTGVEFSALVDGTSQDLGPATLNRDGTFTFDDPVSAHLQGFITATETDGTAGRSQAVASFSLQAGLGGGRTVAEQDTYNEAGDAVLSSVLFHGDGSRTVIVSAPGQSVPSTTSDVFRNGLEPDTTFVFDPGYGSDVIGGFKVGGSDHDVLSLPQSDFTGVADVIRNTTNTSGGAVIADPVSGDTIRLVGVNKGELRQNKQDIAFHG